uniref:hypothetical protein n=1 Tax=Aureivirga sp. CE67 TaxID=1788983 RepID=UPI0018C9A78C
MKINKLTFYITFLLFFIYNSNYSQSDNSTYDEAKPFCADEGLLFPNVHDGSTAESGPNYSCLGSQPNVAWYYLQISTSGLIELTISQNTEADGSGAGLDVDFICWGPFTDTASVTDADLNTPNEIDCSYSAAPVEECVIPNAIVGEFYLIAITNYNGSAGYITVEQTKGGGSTNCEILAPITDHELCEGETLELDATPINNPLGNELSYQWTLLNEATGLHEDIVGEDEATISITTSGTYGVNITDTVLGDVIFEDGVITFHEVAEITADIDDILACELGDETFDFPTMLDAEVLTGLDATLFSVSYHTTEDDANNNENPITGNYTTTTTGTIWVRVENVNSTDCFSTTSFELNEHPEVTVNTPNDLFVCENILVHDLTVQNDVINNSGNVTITYFDNAGVEIVSPASYIGANGDTITAKVVDNTTNCEAETTFQIWINDLPVVTVPANMVQCADNTTFDLTSQDGLVTTETGVTITYYNAAGDEITTADAYTGANNEVITATVTNDTTTCEDSVTFELILNPLPVVTPTYSISDCDLDQDGLITWDISLQTTILDNAGAYTVTYYSDAALTTEITNLNTYVSGDASVFYQLEDNVTGCQNSGLFNLELGAQPVVEPSYQYELCDDLVADGIRSFDLTSLDAQIIGSNFNTAVSYYEVLDFAPGADLPTSPAITNPSDYVSGTNTIFGYVYDVSSGCWTTTEINLVVGEIPVVNLDITHYELCDDDYDGYTLFNLSTKEAEILAPAANPATAIVEYYNTQDDALAGVNQIVAPNIVNYQNATQNVHQVWVKVSYDVSECAAYTSFYVIVHPKPLINEVNNIEMCDDGDGSVAFDLTNTQTTEEILNGQNGISITYFTDLNEANQAVIDEANGNVGSFAYIATPDNFENTVTPVQTIYAVLKNDVTGCGTVTPFNIEVLPQPEFPDELQTLEVCEDDINDGITTVYLTDADAYYNASTPGFIVTYHHTEADAFDGLNAIASPYINNATPDNFTVWVRLENNVTHCFDITT